MHNKLISENIGNIPFAPVFGADGHQTHLATTTGEWNIAYDANDRPVRFTKADGSVIVENGYDYMGRRYMQKITENGTVTRHERYLYRGYLQIAALDLLNGGAQKYALFWDPTEPLATRPLILQTNDGQRYTYAHDLTKNVTELIDQQGNIAATYDYDPFGKVTEAGVGTGLNPIQWSSEVYDPELGLVYYNYRHYNPADGRWINRDPIAEQGGYNLYGFVGNKQIRYVDHLGCSCLSPENISKCILVNAKAVIPNATGAGFTEVSWRRGYELFMTIRRGFILRMRAKWDSLSYADYPRCPCSTVIQEYKKAQYPYAIYATANVVPDEYTDTSKYQDPTIYDAGGHERVSIIGKYQIDEIRKANSLAGQNRIANLNPGLAEFSIHYGMHKNYRHVQVYVSVENPGKPPITIHDQIYRYNFASYYDRGTHYRWRKVSEY